MSASGKVRRIKKTKTIKGDDLENLKRLVSIALDKLGKGGIFTDDKIGYSIVDFRTVKIVVTFDPTMPIPGKS